MPITPKTGGSTSFPISAANSLFRESATAPITKPVPALSKASERVPRTVFRLGQQNAAYVLSLN